MDERNGRDAIWAGLVLLLLAVALFHHALPASLIVSRDLHLHRSWELHNRAALAAGELPLWNPSLFAGIPSLAHIESTFFYPVLRLLAFLPVDVAFLWTFFLHAWLTGFGGYWLARTAGASGGAAVLAGAGLLAGGYVAPRVYAGHVSVVYGWTWLPFALAFAIDQVRSGKLVPSGWLIVVLALQFMSGWLQGMLYTLGAVALYFLFEAGRAVLQKERPAAAARPLLQLALIFIVFLAVIAFQLLPVLAVVGQAGRALVGDMQFAAGGARSLDVSAASAIIAPLLRGPYGPTYTDSPYVGSLLLLFAPFAFIDAGGRRYGGYFALLACVALAFAVGRHLPLYQVHVWLFPGLRIPLRFLALWAVAVAVLGALGLDAAIRRLQRGRHGVLVVAFVAVALTGYGLAWLAARPSAPSPSAQLVRFVALVGWMPLAAPIAVAAAMRWLRWRMAVPVVALFTLVELLTFSRGYIQTTGKPENIAIAALQGVKVGRVLSICENAVSPTQLMDAGYATLDGYAALTLAGYARYGHVVLGQDPDETLEAPRIGGVRRLPMRTDLMDFLNVTHVVACEPVDHPNLRLVRRTEQLLVYENVGAWPRAVWMCEQDRHPSDYVYRRLRDHSYDDRRVLRALPPQLIVRWRDRISAAERSESEAIYRLSAGTPIAAGEWRYDAQDGSARNLSRLMEDPRVVQVRGHGDDLQRPIGAIDELFGRLVLPVPYADEEQPPDLRAESVLAGSRACSERGDVQVRSADNRSGRLLAAVTSSGAGLVVTSEPFFPERRAFVDGQPARLVRVNGAFIGIEVPAGTHQVEIRYSPRSFQQGLSVSLIGLVCWGVAGAAGRRSGRAAGSGRL